MKLKSRSSKVSVTTVLFVSVAILAFVVRIRDINRPFTEYFKYINCQYAVYARNYIWYGYMTTKLGLVSTPYYVTDGNFEYYFHHPPLTSIWISLFFRIFGITEASVRLAEIVLSMLTLFLIYKISKKLWGEKTAIVSSILFALMPLTAYYDRITAPDYSTMPFILSTLYFYILWSESREPKHLLYMSLSLFVGAWFDWQAYIIVLGIILHAILFGFNKNRKVILILLSTAFLAFLAYVGFVYFVGGYEQIVELYQGFLTRSGIKVYSKFDRPGSHYDFTMFQFLVLELKRSLNLFTSITLIFTLVWGTYFLVWRPKKDSYILPLFVQGIVSLLVFKQGAWIHDFWLYQLVPSIVLSAGRGIILFSKLPSTWKEWGSNVPFSVTFFAVLLFGFVGGIFTLMVLEVVYNMGNTLWLAPLILLALIFSYLLFWALSSDLIKESMLDLNALRLHSIIFAPSILLLGYLKNLIYPYVPKYGGLLLLTVAALILLFWIEIKGYGIKLKPRVLAVSLVLVLFASQAIYVVDIQDSWEYPHEYQWGLIIEKLTTPEEGILVIPGTGIHSYSSTFYSKRRVELVWTLQDFLSKMNSSDGNYKYFIANDALFNDPRYFELACYLLSHYEGIVMDGMYLFNLSETDHAKFTFNGTINFDKTQVINISISKTHETNNSCHNALQLDQASAS